MNAFRLALLTPALSLALAPVVLPSHGQESPAVEESVAEDTEKKPLPPLPLHPQEGTIALGDGLATFVTGNQFRYLDSKDAEYVLTKVWGNPDGAGTLGMIVPAGFDPRNPESWAVVMSYEEDGYVSDDDAGKIDYSELLRDMQADTREHNAEREKHGYPPIELVGWAAPPHYDASTHKLYWAKELRFGDEDTNVLNYNIRILGRRGVLVLNAVAGMDQLAEVEKKNPSILAAVDFQDGNRYADFNPSVDKVAAYGIAGLVAGKVLSKAGILAALGVFLVKGWKLVAIAVVAGIAGFAKFFRRSS